MGDRDRGQEQQQERPVPGGTSQPGSEQGVFGWHPAPSQGPDQDVERRRPTHRGHGADKNAPEMDARKRQPSHLVAQPPQQHLIRHPCQGDNSKLDEDGTCHPPAISLMQDIRDTRQLGPLTQDENNGQDQEKDEPEQEPMSAKQSPEVSKAASKPTVGIGKNCGHWVGGAPSRYA